jgi:predicted RecB family nuclease
LICREEATIHHAFWANNDDEEETIWKAFLTVVNQYSTAPIYHFGSYEPRAIARLAKRYKTDTKDLNERLINVNQQIYGKIYFPVYSNQLKDIAGFVGAIWTSSEASGLQSIVWRYRWNETHENRYKETLLIYNEEGNCSGSNLNLLTKG